MILIQGDGVAARVCAYLLNGTGLPFAQQSTSRPRVPAVMLPDSSLRLLTEITGAHWSHEGSQVRRRVVKWGSREATELPHSALVIGESDLLDHLPHGPAPAANAEWNIFCADPVPEVVRRSFGARRAAVARIELQAASSTDACWVESLREGWLFLLPNWLIAVGGDPGVLLGQSTLVAPQLRSIAPTLTHFDAHPAIGWPLSGVDWLAAGSAALRFDPLCGDGTGNAVREAILACAVVKAACGGEDPEALAQHYRLRLLAGFRRHLEVCAQFYQTGGDGPWWTDQLTSLREGLAFCDEFLHKAEFRYRLNGLELEPVA